MTVEELIEQLKAMPQTALVYCSQGDDVDLVIEGLIYDLGYVTIRIEEMEEFDA